MLRFIHLIVCCCLPSVSFACSCIMLGDQAQGTKHLLESATSVVVAEAVAVNKIRWVPNETVDAEYDAETTQFHVKESWKGTHSKEIWTRIITTCCVCGISFEPNEIYLLFLYGPDEAGFYTTSSCAWNFPVEHASEIIAILDELVADKPLSATITNEP